jgi:alpha-tubulin suppressor-like RCC1 family protein
MTTVPSSRARSGRKIQSLFGLGLLAASAVVLPGCGVEATGPDAVSPGEALGAASQASSATCVTIVRGGPGGVSDTRLRQDTPTTAYGAVNTIVTGNQSTNRVTLIGFDLSPIPSGATITSADVTLDEVLNQGPSTISVHAATAAWSEATATWNSFNSAYSAATYASFSNGGAGHTGAVSFSIASLVQGWIDGAVNDGIALLAPTNSTWSSSEATSAVQRPSLAVCYVAPAGPPPASASAIAAGGTTSFALKLDGTLWAAGDNTYGALGDGTNTHRSTPVQVLGLSGVTAITGGLNDALALKSDGTVWGMGYNATGALGDGTTTNRSTPVQMLGLSGITGIAAGSHHSLALKSDGTVWAVGLNFYGQLGDGTTTNRTTPVQVVGLAGITAVAAAGTHSLALKSDGSVWSWGSNDLGQLGDGTTVNKITPVQMSGLAGVTAVSAGYWHSLALEADGTAWAVGSNGSGQLGDGTNIDRSIAVQVSQLSGITAVAAGQADHSLALKSDGTVWAFGMNQFGKLGDGTTNARNTPGLVSGLSGVTAVSAGTSHSLALKSDGSVWAMGDNYWGQLGNGTILSTKVPVLTLLP